MGGREEAVEVAKEEPLLSGFMHVMVLSQPSLLHTLAHVLTDRIVRTRGADLHYLDVDSDLLMTALAPHLYAIVADVHAIRSRVRPPPPVIHVGRAPRCPSVRSFHPSFLPSILSCNHLSIYQGYMEG